VAGKTTLLDIIDEYQGTQQELRSHVVRYQEDGVTPVVIEYTRTDNDGTMRITQRNLETGDAHLRQIRADH